MRPFFSFLVLCFLALCFALKGLGDELTDDPKLIWQAQCVRCTPPPVCCYPEAKEGVVINLQNPLYENGVITTTEGGVLFAPDVRIQAQNICYTKTETLFQVTASGALIIDYKGRTLVGETLFYDFLTHTGVLTQGKTAAFPWFVGGEEIVLLENGNLQISNGYITTSECGEKELAIQAETLTITRNRILTAKKIDIRLKNVPLFGFPQVKVDLKTAEESPLAFNVGWKGFLGSHVGVRYHFLTFDEFKGYARVDAYFKHGLGVGLETEYNPACSPTEFYTRNYYAHDLAIDDPRKKDRHRIQGTYFTRFFENTTLSAIYDFVSDAQFAQDYETNDFALNTAYRTELELRRQEPLWIANLFTRVRVNHFQTINQELPTYEMAFHPFEIFDTQIVSDNYFKLSFLNYVFSQDVEMGHNFHAGRFEARPRLYRPFHFGPVNITPGASLIAIGYTNSPGGHSVMQALGDITVSMETELCRSFGPLRHAFFPYVEYHFLTSPAAPLPEHYLFTIDDAYARLNLLRFGIRQGFLMGTPLWLDVWANAYFDHTKAPSPIPKGYLNLEWQLHPRLCFEFDTAWNFANRQLDFYNERLLWTLSANIALSAEYRHRSRFDWRKGDFYNFLLDSVRSQSALLDSPLSEKRDVAVARLYYRINPDLSLFGEVRKGWNQIFFHEKLPNFLEYKLEGETRLLQHWRLLVTYEKRTVDQRFFVTLKLDRGPPRKQKCSRTTLYN